MNHFATLDGEGVGSDTEPSKFPAWANRRIAHMGAWIQMKRNGLHFVQAERTLKHTPMFPMGFNCQTEFARRQIHGQNQPVVGPGDEVGAGELNMTKASGTLHCPEADI